MRRKKEERDDPIKIQHKMKFSTIEVEEKKKEKKPLCLSYFFSTVQHKGGPDDPRGSNMMSIIPGRRWGTRQDKVLVIAAHWDTMPSTPGKISRSLSRPEIWEMTGWRRKGKSS